MTAKEWIVSKFPNDGDVFFPCNYGDFNQFSISGVNPSDIPIQPPQADIDLWISWFGDALEDALTTGVSIHAALTADSVQQRGWRPYFDLWKAKGIID